MVKERERVRESKQGGLYVVRRVHTTVREGG